MSVIGTAEADDAFLAVRDVGVHWIQISINTGARERAVARFGEQRAQCGCYALGALALEAEAAQRALELGYVCSDEPEVLTGER